MKQDKRPRLDSASQATPSSGPEIISAANATPEQQEVLRVAADTMRELRERDHTTPSEFGQPDGWMRRR